MARRLLMSRLAVLLFSLLVGCSASTKIVRLETGRASPLSTFRVVTWIR